MAQLYGSAKLQHLMRHSFGPLLEGEAGGGGDGGSGSGGSGDGEPTEEDKAAAKAALELAKSFKDAGIDDPAKALDTIRKLRDYEKGTKLPAKVEKELKDLRAAVQSTEDKKLTEAEQTKKLIEDLEHKLEDATTQGQGRVAKAALKASAASAGALYPDDVPKLIDAKDIEFDDDGNPTNTDALVAGLKKDRPALFGTAKPSFDGGARGGGEPPKKDMDSLLRSAAGH